MEDEIKISQEDLNNEMKRREREEYYEDKLLELKMKSFLDTYKINHVITKYKTELDELNKEKDSLLKEKEVLLEKISEIEEEKNNYENTINNLDKQISEAENESKNLDKLITDHQEYVQNLSLEDNLLNHIIETFPDSFKKRIYEICSKNVREALNTNKSSNTKKRSKQGSNLMVVSGEREEFVSKGEQNDSEEQENNDDVKNNNNKGYNNNPMMGYNGQFMMYPMYMVPPGMRNMNMPNMPHMNGNPLYFFPFPMTNIPQNNINKKK